MRGSNEAGWVRYMRVSKARLVCEEVSLVHGLVERSIILLPHLLLAAPRRDEVEATTRLPAARKFAICMCEGYMYM